MQSLRAANTEPIPGYRLVEPLGAGGFGEVWKCVAPGGLLKAIKFVRGGGLHGQGGAERELRALEHLRTIRHSYLLSVERVELVDDDLLIVTELADCSLHDLLVERRAAGLPGIPRAELLGYLFEAAEVLDLMNQEHGLQHLDVKPRNLFLMGRHIKVGDFGLVASLSDLYAGHHDDLLRAITPLYAAPEVFDGRPTLFSDQYSLAVTYHELMTGEYPHKARNFQQMMLLAVTGKPDLSGLPEADRPVVARALSRHSHDRFPSCLAFLDALAEAAPVEATPAGRSGGTSAEIALGQMQTTWEVGSSGVRRKASRVVPAVRPSAGEDDALAGYQLLECLSRGPTGEQWRATAPGGKPCLVRFLTNPDPAVGPAAADPLVRLEQLCHPALPILQRLPLGPGRVALVSEAGATTLATRFKECRDTGQLGLPREEVLARLGRAAEALDEIYHEHQLQHLLLSPRLLAPSGGEVLLLDFGLAELVWLPGGVQLAGLNPRYAALELFDGLISDACDQFSLALIFQELLVGVHPFRNLNARQMANPRLRGQPDVSLLPRADRPVVLQALAAEPERRFRSCREFLLALQAVSSHADTTTVVVPTVARPTPAAGTRTHDPWRSVLEELVAAAARGHEVRSVGTVYYRLTAGQEVEHHCAARLAAGMAQLKLAGFAEHWRAEVRRQSNTRLLMEMRLTGGFLDRCLGRAPSLVVDVSVGTTHDSAGQLTPIRVRFRPTAVSRDRAAEVLNRLVPDLLTSLQTYLHSQCDAASQDRYPLRLPVEVEAVGGQRIEAQTRDVSRRSVGLIASTPVPAGPVTLSLRRLARPEIVRLNGWVRDCLADDSGGYEVEIAFDG